LFWPRVNSAVTSLRRSPAGPPPCQPGSCFESGRRTVRVGPGNVDPGALAITASHPGRVVGVAAGVRPPIHRQGFGHLRLGWLWFRHGRLLLHRLRDSGRYRGGLLVGVRLWLGGRGAGGHLAALAGRSPSPWEITQGREPGQSTAGQPRGLSRGSAPGSRSAKSRMTSYVSRRRPSACPHKNPTSPPPGPPPQISHGHDGIPRHTPALMLE